jgi:aryl carrier-like protein
MDVTTLGADGAASVVLRQHGVCVLCDCPGVPLIAPADDPTPVPAAAAAAAADAQQSCTQAAATTSQPPAWQLQLLVPDFDQLLPPLPDQQQQQQLHAVLISSAQGMLGVAALQQRLRRLGADLPLHTYCSEPCLHACQQLMQELQAAAAALSVSAAHSQHAQQQQQQQQQWQQQQQRPGQQQCMRVPLPDEGQLQAVLDAVQVVRWGQRLRLPGCFGLTAEARPCGCSISSCLWHLRNGSHRCGWCSGCAVGMLHAGAAMNR